MAPRNRRAALRPLWWLDIAAGFEVPGIEFERLVRLLERHQTARVPDDVGVGDAAVLALHGRVRGPRIEAAEKSPACCVFELPFRRADVAVAISDLAAFDDEGVELGVRRP